MCQYLKNFIFFHVDGQRDAASELEYLCVGEVWLRADTGILLDLLRDYWGKIARRASPGDPENSETDEEGGRPGGSDRRLCLEEGQAHLANSSFLANWGTAMAKRVAVLWSWAIQYVVQIPEP